MLKANEYFEGKVRSIGFNGEQFPASVGVMAPGEYRFSTEKRETMQVIQGALTVQLPGSEEWQTFRSGSAFEVPANDSFALKVEQDTAYLCTYHD